MVDVASSTDEVEDLKEVVLEAGSDQARETALDRLEETKEGMGGDVGEATQDALKEIAMEADDDDIAERATELL